MAKGTPIQTNFTGGEISPKLLGRVDLEKYSQSCKNIQNYIVFPHGGLTKRSGTRFVAECKDSTNNKRLIPFIFSTTQAYILEFGNTYIRFYRNEGQIESSGSPYEISSPYAHGDLDGLSFTQSADVLYVTHPNYQTRKITRTGHTTWTVTKFEPQDGPYLTDNTTATQFHLSAHTVGAGRTLTADADTFASTDVDRVFRFRTGWGLITGYTSATVVTVEIFVDTGSASHSTDWALGAWSGTTGWPACATFYQDRLFFGNTTNQPNTVFSSKSGDFENFAANDISTGAVADDSALIFTLSTDQVNAIRWMYGAKQLEIGTSDGPFLMSSGSDNLALTPTNVTVNRESTDGSAAQKPVGASKFTIYTDSNKRRIRELGYKLEVDGFVTNDLTLLAEHITTGSTIKSLAYARSPNNIVWMLLEDGSLRGMTYERDQNVVAFHRHVLGGTDVSIKSIATIPNSTETENQLYLIVSRTINGATKHYVEFLEEVFDTNEGKTVSDAFFVDSGLTYTGSATSSVTGLSHLEGQTVKVLADGATHPDVTVSSGGITLTRTATTIHAGLGYTASATTLDPEIPDQFGTSQGKTRRVERTSIRVVDTYTLQVGPEGGTIEEIPFRAAGDPMDTITLFTGDKRILINHQPDRKFNLVIQHNKPQPCTVLALMYALVVSDR